MERVTVAVASESEAQALDRLVEQFTRDLSEQSSECVFYLSGSTPGETRRIVETETAATLRRFIDFVSQNANLTCL
ncbi:MAG: hypothetical protein GC187_06525 [Alphaproteobacteria bacterium]|nr:hypothetical protein [Alphaproteobacteria bacterium]